MHHRQRSPQRELGNLVALCVVEIALIPGVDTMPTIVQNWQLLVDSLPPAGGLHLGAFAVLGALVGGEVALPLPYTIPMHLRPCRAGRATRLQSRTNQTESGSLDSSQPISWQG